MKDLLQNFDVQQIILFIILLAAAFKGVITWMHWLKDEINKHWQKKENYNKINKDLADSIENLSKTQQDIKQSIGEMSKTIDMLIESDKDAIKAWITKQHHYFCYELGYIDDYDLDCIEKRYRHYVDEGGNSFIHELMEEIRSLPKKSGASLYEIKK